MERLSELADIHKQPNTARHARRYGGSLRRAPDPGKAYRGHDNGTYPIKK